MCRLDLGLFTFLIFSFFAFESLGRDASSFFSLEDDIILQGFLFEQDGSQPLPFATVVLYSAEDSTMVSNALTSDDGSFEMLAPPGSYYAEISFVGFEMVIIDNIVVKDNQESISLGKINMANDAIELGEVVVSAERSQMELKLDRRVFNVGKDLTNSGNTAADILDNVPSVTVDPEGNVSLRGSQSVRILVNGKPSGLLSAGNTDALVRMQGDIIQSVEVITNPSARYEAEGEAGIINIILKKNKEKGVNGSFGLTAGRPDNFGASYNLNMRRKQFNLFSNFGLDYRNSPGGGFSTQQFFNSGELTNFYTTETDQKRGGLGGYMQIGTDWNIDDQNLLTTSFLYRAGDGNNNSLVTYTDLDNSSSIINMITRDIIETETDHNIEASLDYTKTFDTKDQALTITAKYILNDDTEIADYEQVGTDAVDVLSQNSRNTEDERNILFQADYVHPFTDKSKIEGGLRVALRQVNNDFILQELQNNALITIPGFDDQLNYTEDIYAAYFIGAHEFNKLSVQAGLRAELSDITAALLRSENTSDQNYLSFFPSISFAYKLAETRQLQISYSRRLSRPYFRRLLPFSNFNNPRNNRIGNPNLQPEFTDSYEVGYLQYFNKGTLLSSVYYRQTSGVIEELTLPDDDGTSISYPINLSTRDAYGVEFNLSYDLTDDWSINTDLNAFRSIIDGEFEGTTFKADTYSWFGRVNSKIDLGSSVQLQAAFNYNAPQQTTQGRRLSSSSTNLAGSFDVLAGKGTLTLSIRDIFNNRIRRNVVDLPNFKSESEFQWRQTRSVVLTFNYRLNQDSRPGGIGE